jgi:hypothetical protein
MPNLNITSSEITAKNRAAEIEAARAVEGVDEVIFSESGDRTQVHIETEERDRDKLIDMKINVRRAIQNAVR